MEIQGCEPKYNVIYPTQQKNKRSKPRRENSRLADLAIRRK